MVPFSLIETNVLKNNEYFFSSGHVLNELLSFASMRNHF